MEVDQSFIGMATPPFTVEVEKGAIRRFAEALQDFNPLYHDEVFANARGYAGLVAPPTFAASFRPPARQPWVKPLDEGRILAGEQYFSYLRPIIAGDVFECRLQLVNIIEKSGKAGPMYLFVQELYATDAKGIRIVTNGRVLIYRSPGRMVG